MPNSDTALLFIDQILHDPLWIGGAAIGAIAFLLLVIMLLWEMLDNVRSSYWRR